MPNKSSGKGKNLKGDQPMETSTVSGEIDLSDISGSLSGIILNDVTIYGTMMEDVTIGAQLPASANFQNVRIGWPTDENKEGIGFRLEVYGNKPGDYMFWDPKTSVFSIFGSLSVRDAAAIGNLRIRENTLEAIAPYPDGDVRFLTKGDGNIVLAGPLLQESNSSITLGRATNVFVKSDTSIDLRTVNRDIVLTTDDGWGTVSSIQSLTLARLDSENPANVSIILRTYEPHNLAEGQNVLLKRTNSIPSLDGSWEITKVIDERQLAFAYPAAVLLQEGREVGTATRDRLAKIVLDAGKGYFFNENTPLYFINRQNVNVDDVNLRNYPQISAGSWTDDNNNSSNRLMTRAQYVYIDDPIPTLSNYSSETNLKQDIGVMTSIGNTKRFFGFQNDTFTVLNNAAVTVNGDGSKTVTGDKGVMNFDRLIVNNLEGNPDVKMNVSGSIQLTPTSFVSIPDNVEFQIGTLGTYKSNTTLQQVVYTSKGNIRFEVPTDRVVSLPSNVQLSFYDACPQTIYGASSGLHIRVDCGNLYLDVRNAGTIFVPYNVSLQFGNSTSPVTASMITAPTGLSVYSTENIILSPDRSVIIPQSKRLQFGADGLTYIILNDANVLSTVSSGNIHINSGLDTTIEPLNRGMINLSTPYVVLKSNTQIVFGPTATIDNYNNNLTLKSPGNRVILNAPSIDLTASLAVNIPVNVPLKFGPSGSIFLSPAELDLHITNSGTGRVVVDSDTIINGTLQVNGTSTYIHSTVSTYSDTLLSLAVNAPVGDVKDRGFEFPWFGKDRTRYQGALVWQQGPEKFVLIADGTNINEQYTVNRYADLTVGNITANNVVFATTTVSELVGNPDIKLTARSVIMNITNSLQMPVNVPITSLNNSIYATVSGWTIQSSNVNVSGGSLSLGSSTFRMSDINNLRIGGVPNVWIDSVLYVASTIRFGTEQISINVDSQQNMRINTVGNIVLSSPVVMTSGYTMGNANLSWSFDIPGGGIVWKSTLSTTPLTVSLRGSLIDCTWKGETIGLNYGGTGHVGAWQAGSVIFVGSRATSLEEDNVNFFWSQVNTALGIRTSTPKSALTIGRGDLEFVDNSGSVLFRHDNMYLFRIGKDGRNVGFFVSPSLTLNKDELMIPRLLINHNGQVGIGISSTYMSGLSGLPPEAQVYIQGSVRLTSFDVNVASSIGWTTTEYLDNQGAFLNLNARSGIQLKGPTWIESVTYYGLGQQDTYIRADDGTPLIDIPTASTGRLLVSAPYLLQLNAPHVLVNQRLCFSHDTGSCQIYFEKRDSNIAFVSTVGDILLMPQTSVTLADRKLVTLGNGGSLSSNGSQMILTSTGVMQMNPGDRINVALNKALTFGNAARLVQTENAFEISAPTNTVFKTSVGVAERVNFFLGDFSHRLISDGDILRIFGKEMIVMDANIVHITGNLLVSGQSTVTITAETNLDTGIMTMGGAQSLNIKTMEQWRQVQTLITVDRLHSLRIGDTVVILDSLPDIDGTYTVQEVPTPSSFSIAKIFREIPDAAIQGVVRTALVHNPEVDIGIQANWHTGQTLDTSSARAAFFGVKRATNRFTYYVTGRNNAGVFTGVLGDMEINTLYAASMNVATLSGSLSAYGQIVSGDNFVITGGSIDNTPIGLQTPAAGAFTDLTITGSITTTTGTIVTNLNADLLDGYHADAFVMRDGSQPLTADWSTGLYGISAAALWDRSLNSTCVVYAGLNGRLLTTSGFTFDETTNTLSIPLLAEVSMVGDINLSGWTIRDGSVRNVDMSNSNITLGASKTFDARGGTLYFSDDQIHGDWVGGGKADIDITGTATKVINGVYTSDYEAYTILKADIAGAPTSLFVPEQTFVGRKVGGGIQALSFTETRDLLGISTAGSESLYQYGAVMRSGHLEFPEGGTMTGNLYPSYEHVIIETNQTLTASVNVKYSFVNISYSTDYYIATLVLPDGLHAAQEKNIVLVLNQPGCALHIVANFGIAKKGNGVTTGMRCVMEHANQSVSFVWFQDRWMVMPTGAKVVYV